MSARNSELSLAADHVDVANRDAESPRSDSAFQSRLANNEWLISFTLLLTDILCWVVIYGTISFLRRDFFFVGAFAFGLVGVIHLAVLCQALFLIGGYF